MNNKLKRYIFQFKMQDELNEAAKNGNLEKIKDFYLTKEYNKNIDIDQILESASANGHLEIIEYLAKHGPINDENNNETTTWISQSGNLKVIKYLMERGFNIAEYDDFALIWASESGYLEIIEYLVENGANIHIYEDGPLINAVTSGYLEIVKYLVEHGADIHAGKGEALDRATSEGHLEIVKYLVEHGVDIHIHEDVALMNAVTYGHLEIVKYLVEHGANIHVRKGEVLYQASRYGYLEIVKYLVENGVDHAHFDGTFLYIYRFIKDPLQLSDDYWYDIYFKIVEYLKEVTKNRLLNELLIPYFCISKTSPQIRIKNDNKDKIKSAIPRYIIRKIVYSAYDLDNEGTLRLMMLRKLFPEYEIFPKLIKNTKE